jgi:transcription-repair coupling factor (superfamily II helicase)
MRANLRCAARSSISSLRGSARACGSISSATNWKRCGCSIPTPSVRPARVEEHLLLPASEALLDEDTSSASARRYRELFGANATSDPLYQAVSDGRRLAGMEHWLPLFEDRLATLFDHLGRADLIVIDSAAQSGADERFDDIADYFTPRSDTSATAPGSYRPLDPAALYLSRDELDGRR